MITLGEARAELIRLLKYELNLGEYSDENALNAVINRAYAIVCYQAESPLLTAEITYDAAAIKQACRLDLSQYGIRSIYRAWWISGQTVQDLKESYMQQPIVREEFDAAARRVIPSPLDETPLVFPPIRWLPQRIETSPPKRYGFVDGQFFFDSHPPSGTGLKLRLIASFYPIDANSVVKPLGTDTDRFAVEPKLVEAIVLTAASIWIRPYPDLIQLAQYWSSLSNELVQLHRAVVEQNMLAKSPAASIETVLVPGSGGGAIQRGGERASRRG